MLSRQYATGRDNGCTRTFSSSADNFPSRRERDNARHVATGRDRERASGHGNSCPAAKSATGRSDCTRHAATERAATGETSRYVAQLEHQLEVARDDRDFLREQINRKDRTIEALIERDRETNILVRGLQEMLTPLLGGRRRDDPPTYTQ